MSDGSGFFVGMVMGCVLGTLIGFLHIPSIPWVIEQNTRAAMKEAYDRGHADAVITDDEMIQFRWKEKQ